MSPKVEISPIKLEKNVFLLIRDLDRENYWNKILKATQHHQRDRQYIKK